MSRVLQIFSAALFLGLSSEQTFGEPLGVDGSSRGVISSHSTGRESSNNPSWDVFAILPDPPHFKNSLDIVNYVPVSEYWDTAKAQFRVGILGDVLNVTHPELVTILPKTRFVEGKMEVMNMLVPDTSVLFMHMVNVIQSMAVRALEMKSEVDLFYREKEDFALKIIRIASQTGVEWRTAAEIKAARAVVERRLDILAMKLEHENSLMRLRLENHDIRHKLRKDIRDGHHKKLLEMQSEHEKVLDEIRILKQNHSLSHAHQLFLQRYADKEQQLLAKYQFELEQLQLDVELSVEALKFRVLEEQRVERENEDISLAFLRARGESQLKGLEEIIRVFFLQFNSAWDYLIARPQECCIGAAAIVAILAVLVFVSELFKAGKDGIRRLVRRRDVLSQVGSGFCKGLSEPGLGKSLVSPQGVVSHDSVLTLSENNERALRNLLHLFVIHRGSALSEAVAIPNILIQASAGNGKSSVAKFIASCSEVEYAMISGNNIRALGPRADRVFRNVLDECIRRSKSSRDPFLLVIDDVDAFACLEVENDHKYEPQQAALSYCLHMLLDTFKNNSHRFGLIATSSAPTSALHNALLDRIDCIVQIDSPTFRERLLCILKLMQSLMADYIPEVERKALAILLENSADAIEVVVRNRIKRTESKEESSLDVISSCGRLAAASENWTYRDLTKALTGVQCEVLGSERCELTRALWSREIELANKRWLETNSLNSSSTNTRKS